MAPKKARKAADAIDLTEMASPQEKKHKVATAALTTIAKEFICPITQELPIKPVTAEEARSTRRKPYASGSRRKMVSQPAQAQAPSSGRSYSRRHKRETR